MRQIRTAPYLRLTILASLALCPDLHAQGPPPSPPAAPSPGGAPAIQEYTIGPKDSVGSPPRIRGKCSLVAVPPKDTKLASVEISVDGKSLGKSTAQPFKVDFDSASVAVGEHTVKATGRNTAGEQVWTATMSVNVASSPASAASANPAVRRGSPPRASGGRDSAQPRDPRRTARPDRPNRTEQPKRDGKEDARATAVAAVKLSQVYSNDDYGFSIRYPDRWTFKDKTVLMKPRTPGGFWIAFGEYPIEKSKLVVNVKRTDLDPGTDADKFAKYNSYVRSWERRTILDSPAFCTTSSNGVSGQTVHRMIIIRDSHAWMLNCEDSTGKPGNANFATLEAMANSIRPATRKAPNARPGEREEKPKEPRPAPSIEQPPTEPPPAPPVPEPPSESAPPPAPADDPAPQTPDDAEA